MAARKKINKSSPKKNTRRKKKQSLKITDEFKKIFIGVAILVSLCLTGAMIADIVLKPSDKKKPEVKKPLITEKQSHSHPDADEVTKEVPKLKTAAAQLKKKDTAADDPPESKSDIRPDIKYEVFGEVDQTMIEKKFVKLQKGHLPRIVIIIDDIGYDRKIAMALYDLDPNITFSILPFSPFGQSIAKQLHDKGAQLMLHLPMEPFEYPEVNPGPGAILSSMSPDDLLAQLRKNIDNVPNIAGVNNHMGSKITTNADQMNQIFSVLKKENLFFIDSRTAPKSQGKASARLFNLKFGQRDIFLDNFQNTEYITKQFKKLIRLSEKHGFAIGIGHPYPATLNTLSRELPKAKKKISIVKAESLTAIPG